MAMYRLYVDPQLLPSNYDLHTGSVGPDLLGVYDIQEPIYNYLEDNILQIFPRFMEHITPSVQKHLYIMRSVPTHPLMTYSIQLNTETLIDP